MTTVGYIVLGRLRRDTMLLDSGESQTDLSALAEAAVKQGRASETFVIAVAAHFSESDVPWGGIDGTSSRSDHSSLAPLNPGAGEQEALPAQGEVDFTSPQNERRIAAEEGQKGVNTGTNSAGEPTPEGLGKVPEHTASFDKAATPAKK